MRTIELAAFARAALMGELNEKEIDFFSTVRNVADEIIFQRNFAKDPLNAQRPNTLRRNPPYLPRVFSEA